tara:strand:+ start:1235 stop:1489 length:255 start_codon:yes stop_codon:yes gene_type:complete
MKTLEQKIEELTEGTKVDIPLISSRCTLYRVTPKAIQLNCVNNGMVWIPKSQICDIDQTTGEMVLSSWIEEKINRLDGTSSGAY